MVALVAAALVAGELLVGAALAAGEPAALLVTFAVALAPAAFLAGALAVADLAADALFAGTFAADALAVTALAAGVFFAGALATPVLVAPVLVAAVLVAAAFVPDPAPDAALLAALTELTRPVAGGCTPRRAVVTLPAAAADTSPARRNAAPIRFRTPAIAAPLA
ncbi:MAG TPA: hypothetical protein VLJ82_14830, partial [Jatrophihabitans sp.]|nr:hypothetical protein [Jatrophihabitans sp.]